MRYSSPVEKAREQLQSFDHPHVPNFIEGIYNRALSLGREIQDEMGVLGQELEETERLRGRISDARSEACGEELSEDGQLALLTIARVEEWAREPQLSVWKSGPVKSIKDMEEIMEGIVQRGLSFEKIEEKHAETRGRYRDDYGLQVRPLYGTTRKIGPILTGRTYADQGDGRAEEILGAAVGAGQATLHEDSIDELSRLKETIGQAAARVKAANRILEAEISRINGELAMSRRARSYLEEIPEL